ncbi:MAG: hypothetical protein JXM70_08450 [Pirellulales bacterium]|nr:hypothetical protein [Pirellulales bacterium]
MEFEFLKFWKEKIFSPISSVADTALTPTEAAQDSVKIIKELWAKAV